MQINRAIIDAQEHERNELSKELHDNINQILSSASILLSAVKGNGHEIDPLLDKTHDYIELAIQEIRKISRALNSSMIGELGLGEPVREIIGNMRLMQMMDVDFDYDEALENLLPPDMQLMLYRVIQEQTNNIIRYARATRVIIAITKKADAIHLVIEDNGNGFDLKKTVTGIGLINIRNRVEVAGGHLQIITQPGQGCRMAIEIPLIK